MIRRTAGSANGEIASIKELQQAAKTITVCKLQMEDKTNKLAQWAWCGVKAWFWPGKRGQERRKKGAGTKTAKYPSGHLVFGS
jgi:hypothetical protein